jgi:hypothetical protein
MIEYDRSIGSLIVFHVFLIQSIALKLDYYMIELLYVSEVR